MAEKFVIKKKGYRRWVLSSSTLFFATSSFENCIHFLNNQRSL